MAYLFIAHDLAVVRHISDCVAVMYLGRIVEMGDRDAIYARPRFPTPYRCSPQCRCQIRALSAPASGSR